MDEKGIIQLFIDRKQSIINRLNILPNQEDLDKLSRINDEFYHYTLTLSKEKHSELLTLINKY